MEPLIFTVALNGPLQDLGNEFISGYLDDVSGYLDDVSVDC